MKNAKEITLKYLFIGSFSAFIYCSIELIFRNRTHWLMGLLAFIVGLILSVINDEILEYDDYYEVQVLFGTLVCILFEGLFGMIFNYDYQIWDYRNTFGSFFNNQLNLIFCGAWMLITAFGIPLLDWIQYKLKLAPKPYYRFWILETLKNIRHSY